MINAVQQTLEVVDRAETFGISIPESYQARMANVIAARNGELPEEHPEYERLINLTSEVSYSKAGLKSK